MIYNLNKLDKLTKKNYDEKLQATKISLTGYVIIKIIDHSEF